MRTLLLLTASALLLAGCFYPGPEEAGPAESSPTGDEGIGSSGVDGTGSAGVTNTTAPQSSAMCIEGAEDCQDTVAYG